MTVGYVFLSNKKIVTSANENNFFLNKNQNSNQIKKEDKLELIKTDDHSFKYKPFFSAVKIENIIEKDQQNKIFIEHQDKAEKLSLNELNKEIFNIELNLKKFSKLNYEQFTTQQLKEFNDLNRKKVIFLKTYIFKKYTKQIPKNNTVGSL